MTGVQTCALPICFPVTIRAVDDATKDLNRLLNNRRSKPTIFEDNIGYVIKKEHTEDKGVHFHAFFMFDGQKVLKDAFKAHEIGTYWNENITKGKGTYYNCNRTPIVNMVLECYNIQIKRKEKILIKL